MRSCRLAVDRAFLRGIRLSCSPSPPPPPNYAEAATAQGAANKESAIASNLLNNPNVTGPYGSQSYIGGEDGGRPTLVQSLNPDQQALYNQQTQLKGLLGGLGVQGAGALGSVVGRNLDLSGAPKAPGSYDQTRKQVIDAMMGRANEDYAKRTDQTNSDLVAAGIGPGTKAYADKMQMIERSRNDARQQAEIAGGNATAQAFTTDAQRRKDAIAEILAGRQTPLNEITALMSGSQVSNPFSMPGYSQNANVQPAPIFNAATQQYGANADTYNAQAQQSSNTTQGLMSLAGSAAMMMF